MTDRLTTPAPESYLVHERSLRDRAAPIYERSLLGYPDQVEWRSLWRRLHRKFRKGEAILDAGCGTGRFGSRLLANGGLVVGVDYSLGMLSVARRRSDVRVPHLAQGDLRRLPFTDGRFDQILCAQVLMLLIEDADAIAALRELRRVLRPGGQLIVNAYNYCLPRRVIKDKVRRNDPSQPSYRRFTKREFVSLLLCAFLPEEIVGVWGHMNFVSKPLDVYRWFPSRVWGLLMGLDLWVERTPLGFLTGWGLIAEIKKVGGKAE